MSLQDTITMLVLPMAFIVVIIVMSIAYNQTAIGINLAKDSIPGGENTTQVFTDVADKHDNYWDALGMLIIFGIWLITIISSFLLGNNPIFLFMYIMASFAFLMASIVISVFYTDFIAIPVITNILNGFPAIYWYMRNSLVINIFFIVTNGLALYFKRSASE